MRRSACLSMLPIAASIVCTPAFAGTMSVDLNRVFSGSQPNAAGPWVRLVFTDVGANEVHLTIETLLTGSAEFHSGANKGLYLNLDPALSVVGLTFTPLGSSPTPTVQKATNAFKADGVGGHFDILMNFGQRGLTGTSPDVMYKITHSGGSLSVDDFMHLSHNANPSYLAATHVQGLAGGRSGWIGGTDFVDLIPLPSAGAMSLGGIGILAARRRRP